MTAIVLLLAIAAVGYLVATVRTLRHDHPSAPPPSHADWSTGPPSHPYASR